MIRPLHLHDIRHEDFSGLLGALSMPLAEIWICIQNLLHRLRFRRSIRLQPLNGHQVNPFGFIGQWSLFRNLNDSVSVWFFLGVVTAKSCTYRDCRKWLAPRRQDGHLQLRPAFGFGASLAPVVVRRVSATEWSALPLMASLTPVRPVSGPDWR